MNAHVTNFPQSITPNSNAPTVSATVSNTAVTLATLGINLEACTRYVMISIETAPIRVCPEGGTPTTALGQPLAAGQSVLLYWKEAAAWKMIRSTAADATIQVSQYTE